MLALDIAVRREVAQRGHAKLCGFLEIGDMAGMQRVERAVHHGHFAAIGGLRSWNATIMLRQTPTPSGMGAAYRLFRAGNAPD